MFHLFFLFTSLVAATLTFGHGSHDSIQRFQFHTENLKTVIQKARTFGLDISGVDHRKNIIELVATETEIQEFMLMNPDMAIQLNILSEESQLRAPDSEYTSYAELTTLLQNYQTKFPNLVKVESLGISHEKRTIWGVRITGSQDPSLPVIAFTGMHHAREVMSVEVPIDMIEMLTSKYGNDPTITRLLDSRIVYLIPMVNPDGNDIVWNKDSNWRKNAWIDPNSQAKRGVDLNRNYDFMWGSCNGSSANPSNATYRGPSAGSEPETQVIQKWAAKVLPVSQISYHSFSELVLYPYGCDGSKEPDSKTIVQMGEEMASLIKTDDGKSTYQPGYGWELLYGVDGDDTAYLYGKHGTFAYVIELNDSSLGFQPNYKKWRQSTVERNRPGWMYLLKRLDGPGVEIRVVDKATQQPIPKAKIEIQGLVFNQGESRRETNHFGKFFYQTLPGQFVFNISQNGYSTQSVIIDVKTVREIVTIEL